MDEKEIAKTIAQNLKNIAYENQKTQADIARDLGINKATISSWMNGTRIPRMSKIDLLCHYFNCKRSDIMEKKEAKPSNPNLHLTKDELSLVAAFRSLNATGKRKALEYISDLSDVQKYTKDTISLNA